MRSDLPGYIYGLYDPVTWNLRYVGQTIDYKRRYARHLSNARNLDSKDQTYCERWVAKRLRETEEPPILRILVSTTRDCLDKIEAHYVSFLNKFNDLTNISGGGKVHFEVSKSTREKISKAGKGRKFTEIHKKRISESQKGKTISQSAISRCKETKIKNGTLHLGGKNSHNYGVPKSEETKRRISLAKSKEVHQYTLEGEFVRTWRGCSYAAECFGINESGISSCALGGISCYKNFIWVYDTSEEYITERVDKYLKVKSRGLDNPEISFKPRVILQYSLDGEFIRSWGSVTAAAKSLNKGHSLIAACARGKRPDSYGYQWKYKDIG